MVVWHYRELFLHSFISKSRKRTFVASHAAQICELLMANQGVGAGAGFMPQANDYNLVLGQARAIALIQELISKGKTTVEPPWGCIRVTSGLRPDGYAHTKRWSNDQLARRAAGHRLQRNTEVNLLIHRVAFLARHGRDVNGVASHTCENRNCILHVVDETQSTNLSRRDCPPSIVCPVHGTVLYSFCQHNPRCQKTPLNGSCCQGDQSPAHESTEGGSSSSRVIPDSQEEPLSDFVSLLGDPESQPDSHFLELARQVEEDDDLDDVDDEGLEGESLPAALGPNVDDREMEEEPDSSPPHLPARRRSRPLPVLSSEDSSSQPPQDPSSSSMGSFIVGDDVIMYDTSIVADDEEDTE